MQAIITIFIFLLCSNIVGAQTIPGFETTYLDASQRAKETGKNNVIIFTESDNKSAAWMTEICLKDGSVLAALRKSYVGVVIDRHDFDGRALMKRWKLTKVPAVAILDRGGQLIATANHGMTKEKMIEFVNYYALEANAGKSMNFSDVGFTKMVNDWQGYKGAEKPLAKPSTQDIAMTTPVQNNAHTSARNVDPVEATEAVPSRPPTDNATSKAQNTAEGKYIIQGGVFGSEANATALRDKINTIPGLKAEVEKMVSEGKTLFRVIVAGFATRDEAERANELLAGKQIKGIIREP